MNAIFTGASQTRHRTRTDLYSVASVGLHTQYTHTQKKTYKLCCAFIARVFQAYTYIVEKCFGIWTAWLFCLFSVTRLFLESKCHWAVCSRIYIYKRSCAVYLFLAGPADKRFFRENSALFFNKCLFLCAHGWFGRCGETEIRAGDNTIILIECRNKK